VKFASAEAEITKVILAGSLLEAEITTLWEIRGLAKPD
jgi:hypothetical protein